MQANEYQQLAARTMSSLTPYTPATEPAAIKAAWPLPATRLLVNGYTGLCGEAGELADLFKKHLFHGHRLDLDKVKKELGDVAWYMAELCSVLGLELGDVLAANIEKLKQRYPAGFSCEASINRTN